MAGKFVLKKGSSGRYHFNLLAAHGQVIATSETYERKESALNGIESVKTNAPRRRGRRSDRRAALTKKAVAPGPAAGVRALGGPGDGRDLVRAQLDRRGGDVGLGVLR
jgi:uncharacterized protein YegP (UPF0339 family)